MVLSLCIIAVGTGKMNAFSGGDCISKESVHSSSKSTCAVSKATRSSFFWDDSVGVAMADPRSNSRLWIYDVVKDACCGKGEYIYTHIYISPLATVRMCCHISCIIQKRKTRHLLTRTDARNSMPNSTPGITNTNCIRGFVSAI